MSYVITIDIWHSLYYELKSLVEKNSEYDKRQKLDNNSRILTA